MASVSEAATDFLQGHSLVLNRLRVAALLFVFASLLRAQSVAPAPAEPAERAETGRARLPSGTEVAYRIRLLPVASFPSLPAAFAKQLLQRNCMVPQTFEAREPENVIHGAFEKQGSEDWAALCSIDGMTTLFVFFQSHPGAPIALRRQPDAEWLGAEVVGNYGSAWGIGTRTASQIQSLHIKPQTSSAKAGARVERIDHCGIEDVYLEHSSSVHYFHDGEWVTLESPSS